MIRGKAKTNTMTATRIGVFERKIKNPILPMSHIDRIWRKTGEFSRNERPAVKAGCPEMSCSLEIRRAGIERQAPLVRARGLLFLETVQVQKELSHPSAAQTSANGLRVTGPKTPRG